MAKITLFPIYTLVMIFALIWNHGNATTPRKLGVRHNAVTSLSNADEATFGGSKHQKSPTSSSLAHASVINPKGPFVQNEATARKLETGNPIIVTNEAVDSHESLIHSLSFSSSPAQTNVLIPRKWGEGNPFRQLAADTDETTIRKIPMAGTDTVF